MEPSKSYCLEVGETGPFRGAVIPLGKPQSLSPETVEMGLFRLLMLALLLDKSYCLEHEEVGPFRGAVIPLGKPQAFSPETGEMGPFRLLVLALLLDKSYCIKIGAVLPLIFGWLCSGQAQFSIGALVAKSLVRCGVGEILVLVLVVWLGRCSKVWERMRLFCS